VRLVTTVGLWILCAASACATANSGDDSADDAPPADAAAGPPDGGGDRPDAAPQVVASACPELQFATGFDESGKLECRPIDGAALSAVNQQCSLYLGWRDSCDGCNAVPDKWGRASGADCANGVGAGDTCTTASLAGLDVQLFGLSTGGDVDGNDKLYFGWHCAVPEDAPVAGPCADGSYLSSVDGGGECVTARAVIAAYASGACTLFAGWRDSCDGCATAPAKWGQVNDAACGNGAGADDTCTRPTLGDQQVRLFGLNTDGDVNDDDKFYLGFQCSGAAPVEETVDGACPDGELVVAVEEDGRVRCASPLPAAEAILQASCQIYSGWRDGCGGCSTAPAKWGRVGHATCENGGGLDNTCAASNLGGNSVQLFGLNTDGDVDDNDKFYLGFTCQ
jgi:hypothetical protein